MLAMQPIDFKDACGFVRNLHRHHRPPVGSKFCLAVNDGSKIVGVVIVGRPVARLLDDGITLEVTRCCTDGTRNACSMLYGAAAKVAKVMGYAKILTYTLPEEGGSSLRGAGWVLVSDSAGGSKWNNAKRCRADDWPLGVKCRWELKLNDSAVRFRLNSGAEIECQMSIFDGDSE